MTRIMENRFGRGLALLLLIPGLIFAASCAKKMVKSGPGATVAAKEKAGERKELAERERFLNEDIRFEFDRSRLLPGAKEILGRKAKWLLAHPDVSATIEGHCDERGTNEYNMALGTRRARSAKNFLVKQGILTERLKTISYGEESPLDARHNEEAWAKNRRAHFS